MSTRLDRLLWRHEYGKLAPELLELAIRRALDDVGSSTLDLLPRTDTIRLWNPDLLQSRSSALHDASRAVNRARFREAIRHLRRYETTVASIRELLRSVTAIDGADDVIHTIHDRAEVSRLRTLPTVASLCQLIDAARQCMFEQRYLLATNIARLVTRMASSLLLKRDAGDAESIEKRLRDVEELCVASRPFAEPGDDPSTDGSLRTLRALFNAGYGVLGERLLGELETQLGARRRFLLHCRSIDDPERARMLVRDLSWDGAIDHYWHQSLLQYAATLEQQRQTVAATTLIIDSLLASEEESPPKESRA